jgi:radical SAM superfamily enzyme YgiQ (UPF0313 family)
MTVDNVIIIEPTRSYVDKNLFSFEMNKLLPRGIKRILFIQPPDLDVKTFKSELAVRKRYWNYPPYGLMALAAVARSCGCEVKILNLQDLILKETIKIGVDNWTINSWQDTVEHHLKISIETFNPDFVGFTCMFSLTHKSLLDCIDLVREISATIPIALGGVHISNSFSDITTRAQFCKDIEKVNLIFEREAEDSLQELIELANNGFNKFPRGIFLLNDDPNTLNINSEYLQPSVEKLNLMPAFDLSSPRDLSKSGRIGTFESLLKEDTPIATALFNRGCRAECSFCSVRNFNGKGVRGKTVDAMIEELKILRFDHGIEHIMWLDDDLLFDRRKSIELFNRMVIENIKMTWDTTNGVIAASCTEEIISAAADSGCIGMILGMESGNDKILKKIKKPGNVRHFLMAADVLKRYPSINTRVFIMLGFPGETYGQMMDTYNVASEMNLDWSNVNILQPLPNTPIFEEMSLLGMLDPKKLDFNEISFSLGASGKLSGRRSGNKDMLADEFNKVFDENGKDAIPTRSELDDIWAYMNFHLNFKRLDKVYQNQKLEIQYKWLQSICDNLAPRNGFAKYYLCILEKRKYGDASQKRKSDLDNLIHEEPYWANRLNEFGLKKELI